MMGISPKSNTRSVGAGYVNVRLGSRDQGYYPRFVIHVHVRSHWSVVGTYICAQYNYDSVSHIMHTNMYSTCACTCTVHVCVHVYVHSSQEHAPETCTSGVHLCIKIV